LLGCKNIIATDFEESVLQNLKENVTKNVQNTENIEVKRLEWGNSKDMDNIKPSPDVIICCECLYNEAPWDKLLDTLIYFSDLNNNLQIIFAYKKRYYTQEIFIENFVKHFSLEYIEKDKFNPEFQLTNDFVIFIAKKIV
jgi:hypothetical protein